MDKHQMKKKFGQNFLTDKNLLNKIVSEAQIENKDVIEIGPGQGALTNYLVKSAKSVTAYEVDLDLKPFLNGLENQYSNLNVIFGDILKQDIDQSKTYHVVANIPYNITSPIIFKLLELNNVESATLMVQKEVCDRITSKPNNKTYNGLSVIIQYYMDVEKLMNVSKKLFHPVPKVDSAVFRMVRKVPVLNKEQEVVFLRLVKAAFHQKRKTILNNLSFSENVDKTQINDFLASINIDGNLRAENVSVSDFTELARKWPF